MADEKCRGGGVVASARGKKPWRGALWREKLYMAMLLCRQY